MTTPTPNICDVLKQNLRLFQIQNPPIRYTPVNPYTNKVNPKTGKPYTPFDFNMRRKVEILKYSSNTQTSQTNSLTKSQKWSQIVSGNYQTESYTIVKQNNKRYINGQLVDNTKPSIQLKGCVKPNIPTISTACDVPGPPILLYEDESVPLYNYIPNRGSYAQQNEITSPNWYIESYNDVASFITIPTIENSFTKNDTNPSTIATLYIVSPKYSASTFNMTIPIAFYYAIDVSSNITYSTKTNITLDINNINFSAYVNGNIVPFLGTPIYQENLIFDVSLNINPIKNTYYIGQYVGSLNISNIALPTTSGNVYDFQISYILDINNIDTSYNNIISNTVTGIISNVTQNANSDPTKIGSSIRADIPNIPSSTNYAVIQNPTNGFTFSEN